MLLLIDWTEIVRAEDNTLATLKLNTDVKK